MKKRVPFLLLTILIAAFTVIMPIRADIKTGAESAAADPDTKSATESELKSNSTAESEPATESNSNTTATSESNSETETDSEAAGAVRLPVIMYHSTSFKRPGKYNIPPSQLESDLVYLKKSGYTTVTVADLIAFSEGGIFPEKPVMLTFDDGYMNNYLHAFPLLKKHNAKCVLSVIGCLTDLNYRADNSVNMQYAHVTYEQIKEMHDSGLVEIQNHTYSMHDIGKKNGRRGLKRKNRESFEEYEKALSENLTTLESKLKERAGITCSAVAYPYGFYTVPDTNEIVKKLGYRAAFTCREGMNYIKPTGDLLVLKRYNRAYGKSSAAFFKKIAP
jgi:peptidoglycan/xylan/chitin deacetylase (PgdA/CDA1 family)